METEDKFKNSPIHDKGAIIDMMDKLEPKEMVKVVNFIQEQIKHDQLYTGDICEKCNEDTLNKITRFEVIDKTGRVYVNNSCNIELSYQDDGKTLKIFIKDGK